MDEAGELETIAAEMDAILARFKNVSSGLHIASGDQAKFTGLVLRARELMDIGLGLSNRFGLRLDAARSQGKMSYLGTQNYHSVEEGAGIVRAAAETIRSKAARGPRQTNTSFSKPAESYVSLERITELLAIGPSNWDLRKLIRLCEELNAAHHGGNYLSVAMLLRAITDHVPPIFDAGSFAQYAANCGGKSHQGSMKHLEVSLRNIANGILHQPIRKSESLPTASQVNFHQDLDVLLGEVARVLRESSA